MASLSPARARPLGLPLRGSRLPCNLLRFAVAAVFLTAAVSKLYAFQEFTTAVSLAAIPHPLVLPASVFLLAAEVAAGLSLCFTRTLRVGAEIGGLLATSFLTLTTVKLAQGTPTQCSCFGVFLQLGPYAMVGLDALLLAACLILLILTCPAPGAALAAGGSGAAVGEGAASGRQRAVPVAFVVAAYLIVFGEAFRLGLDKDRRTELQAANAARTIVLRYGDPAPPFALTAGSGQVVSAASLRGKWALLTFVRPGCSACELELHDIARQWPVWGRRMNALVVLPGRPLLGSPGAAAHEFRARLGFPMAVACDPDRRVTKAYCDQPLHTPFSVLLDQKGAVRFIQDGRGEGAFGLVNEVNSLLIDQPYGPQAALLRSPALGRRAPDGELLTANGRLRLSSLWRKRPVVLAFVLRDCGGCMREVDTLERSLGNSSAVSVVYAYPTVAEAVASAHSRPVRGLVAADSQGTVHTAYQVWRAPATFLLHAGRILYASGPRSDPEQLERLIRARGIAGPASDLMSRSRPTRRYTE